MADRSEREKCACKETSMQIRSMCLSAHLDSFCRSLDELAGLEFVYKTEDPGAMRRKVGWKLEANYKNGPITEEADKRAEECEVLIEMMREIELMERRAQKGRKTAFVSERWLKPLVVKGMRLPAILRLLVPSYFRMVRRFVRLMDDQNFWVLPCGVHAARDFVRLYRLMKGDWRCLFRTPKVSIARELGGAVDGFPRMKLWGYFVEGGDARSACAGLRRDKEKCECERGGQVLKILWCGRMIDWKRVDVLIKAFKQASKQRVMALQIVGEGPELARLKRLAGELGEDALKWTPGKISFNGYLPNSQVRELMHEADVYVMPSNAEEGWGAIVSEALVEGCPVISTWEAGSSATLLSNRRLYHANSVKELCKRILEFDGTPETYEPKAWSGEAGAKKLIGIIK